MHLSALALLYAQAHVPLLKGASSGPNFGSLATALNTTQVGVLTGDLNGTAFFANRVSFCAWPYFWLSFAAPTTNYTLMVGGSVPVIERFQQIRVAAALKCGLYTSQVVWGMLIICHSYVRRYLSSPLLT